MQRVFAWLAFAAALELGASSGLAQEASPAVGEDAPELKPSEWFNARENTTWESLKGRVILVENWATT